MKTNIKKPKLKLVGEDGNAFSIISRTRTALRRAGYEEDHVGTSKKRLLAITIMF